MNAWASRSDAPARGWPGPQSSSPSSASLPASSQRPDATSPAQSRPNDRHREDPAVPDGVGGPPQGLPALRDPVEGEADLRDARDADGVGFVHQAADRSVDRRNGPP